MCVCVFLNITTISFSHKNIVCYVYSLHNLRTRRSSYLIGREHLTIYYIYNINKQYFLLNGLYADCIMADGCKNS